MKILYGVQGTGNGHVTRARALAKHFTSYGVEADYLFSGREKEQYFDMDVFGNAWQCKKGLTFLHNNGKLNALQTIANAKINTLFSDIKTLDLSKYDAVITDFEPITAWAAKKQNVTCIGIGHQYAFEHNVPKAGETIASKAIMNNFAPADFTLGLHWHHFNSQILPPIAETRIVDSHNIEHDKILVYCGFENNEDVMALLEQFPSYTFVVYGNFKAYECIGNIQLKPLSREGFKHDLSICGGVISNAGFELASEAIQLGKKLLVKPLQGQMEQLSNAKALEELNLGMTMNNLNCHALDQWLNHFQSHRVVYPNVAKAIVEWVSRGHWNTKKQLIASLWNKTEYIHLDNSVNQNKPIQEFIAA